MKSRANVSIDEIWRGQDLNLNQSFQQRNEQALEDRIKTKHKIVLE